MRRKTTTSIYHAWKQGKRFTMGNTRTDGSTVWLHGNPIIRRDGPRVEFSLAGWDTLLTRERLSAWVALVRHKGVTCFLSGAPVPTKGWLSIYEDSEFKEDPTQPQESLLEI